MQKRPPALQALPDTAALSSTWTSGIDRRAGKNLSLNTRLPSASRCFQEPLKIVEAAGRDGEVWFQLLPFYETKI